MHIAVRALGDLSVLHTPYDHDVNVLFETGVTRYLGGLAAKVTSTPS